MCKRMQEVRSEDSADLLGDQLTMEIQVCEVVESPTLNARVLIGPDVCQSPLRLTWNPQSWAFEGRLPIPPSPPQSPSTFNRHCLG